MNLSTPNQDFLINQTAAEKKIRKKIKATITPYVVPLAKGLHQASEKKFENVPEQRQWIPTYMLDHPITVVLNVFWHWKAIGLKVSKFMGIQNQDMHIMVMLNKK